MKRSQIIILFAALLLMTALLSPAIAQECGPGCPACSGSSTGSLLAPANVMATALYIPDGEEETAVFKVRAGIFPWLNVGAGYALDEEETIWSVRLQAITEQENGWRPGVILGSGSVQTGGSDQSAYVQVLKNRKLTKELELSVSGGYATDMPDFDEHYGLANAGITLMERVSPFYTYDGRNSHVGIACYPTEWLVLTGYYLELEEPAISVGFKWDFR